MALFGGLLGMPIALFGTGMLANLRQTAIPMLGQIQIDFRVLLFTFGVAILTGVLFGLVPAFEASRSEVANTVKESTAGAGGAVHSDLRRSFLIVSEIALSLVLLGGAGLMIRSFVRLLQSDLGFHPEHIAVVRADPGPQMTTVKEVAPFLDRVIESVRVIPGVQAVSVTDALPLDRDRSWGVRASATAPPRIAFVRYIGPEYFAVMQIPLMKGRAFDGHDNLDGAKVIVVNETMARTIYPGQDPIGREIITNGGPRRIVGVVRDVKHSALDQESGLEFYLPYAQGGDGVMGIVGGDLVVKTSLEPSALASALRRTIWDFAPNQPLSEFRTVDQLVETAASPQRFIMLLLGVFAGLALLLAAIGIYGVISYSVGQRTRELGIRMALGADAWGLQVQVIKEAMILAGIGTVLGIVGLLALSRYVASLLFKTSPVDPAVFLLAAAVLVAVALVAAWMPARHAAHIDPTAALRYE